eukprot:TRINITY_DN660_c0_g1_i2.p1 TRINITY_DN660_c0_g1~~TRINITY_DN660_c0_g1_i2.p1  ORF type:complete len:250 (+),score=38.98 TRINITY_DN660_c0_g1_i2:440-1189(+)
MLELQPTAVAFNGYGISQNPLRWVGTESGYAPYPNWSTGPNDGGGDPTSDAWCPAECDTTLQRLDKWFYDKWVGLRTLSELKDVYDSTVGRNGNLLLDFAPNPDGLIPDNAVTVSTPSTAANAKPRDAPLTCELGDWIRNCYGKTGTGRIASTSGNATVLILTLPGSLTVDRIIIQEDQAYGQRIRQYELKGLTASGATQAIATGTSVGNKRIEVLSTPAAFSQITLTVTSTTDTPHIPNFAAHNCVGL